MLHTYGSWQRGMNRMGGWGVIRDENGRWVSGFSTMMGAGDAFKVVLTSLHKGLLHTWELELRNVVSCVDFLEVQHVLTNNGDVQNYWHKEVILLIRTLLARNCNVSVVHIPREMNTVANALAKLAIIDDWNWKVWRFPHRRWCLFFARI